MSAERIDWYDIAEAHEACAKAWTKRATDIEPPRVQEAMLDDAAWAIGYARECRDAGDRGDPLTVPMAYFMVPAQML